MNPWSELELTEYERRFVRHYQHTDEKGKTYPGVLRRTYPLFLTNQAIPEINILQARFSERLQISRRARVFGLTFSGNLDQWSINLKKTTGETFNPGINGLPDIAIPNTLQMSTNYFKFSLIGEAPIGSNAEVYESRLPFIMEPNIELWPNTTLIFEGQPYDLEQQPPRRVLAIGVHVWEFPGMDNVNREQGREAIGAPKPGNVRLSRGGDKRGGV